MDVSIIIVNWNTRELVLQCIKQIIDTGEGRSQEIIVVDNASADGSADAIECEYPEVVVVRNERNQGFAKANNVGIRKSKGRYICLINSDVQVLRRTIKRLISYMDENPSVGIIGPKILYPNMTLQNSCRKYPTLWTKLCETIALNRLFPDSSSFSGEHMEYFAHDRIMSVESLAGCVLMIRKSALDQVGLFDEQYFIYSEETDLCKRFNMAGWGIIFLPDVSAIHNHGASTGKDPIRFMLEQQKSVMKYWNKHHSFSAGICFIILLFIHHSVRYLWGIISYIATPKKRVEAKRRMVRHRACIRELILPPAHMKGNT